MSISLTIPVDAKTADAFARLSVQEKEKLTFLLSLQIKNSLNSDISLLEIMDNISQEAEEKGLTPAILESLLDDE